MQRKTMCISLVACALAAASCSDTPQTPLSPSGAAPTTTFQHPDGSSMKVTAPTNLDPSGGVVLDTLSPTLSFTNATGKFATVGFAYEIEIQDEDDTVVYERTVGESSGSTTHEAEIDLSFGETFWWRVRAVLDDQAGPWSPFAEFRTPEPTPTSHSGSGPRAADPPPGQLLPIPHYGLSVVMEMAARHPGELRRACKNNHEWLFLLVEELRKHDSRWGLNWKRGDPRQGMSTDIVSYNPTDQPDNGNGRVYIFDVIGAECEANRPGFNDATGHTWPNRGNSLCGPGTYCTMWTLDPYINAGFKP